MFEGLVDLVDRCVEVIREPSGRVDPPAYQIQQTFRPGESIPLALQGRAVGTIAVDDMLP